MTSFYGVFNFTYIVYILHYIPKAPLAKKNFKKMSRFADFTSISRFSLKYGQKCQ